MIPPRPDLRGALALAPMATLTHRGFRELVSGYGGCDLYFTEMANAASVASNGRFEEFYVDPEPFPERTVVQLVGGREEDILKAVGIVHGRFASAVPGGIFGIDINMGCSAPQITRSGAGAAWLSRPVLALALADKARALCPKAKLSVKMRLGAQDDPEALLSFCRGLESAGIDFLTLHPRLRGDILGRPARWERVGLLKRELGIPVLGNGDVASLAVLRKRQEETACDGFMIGRGAVRMPWIFAALRARSADPSAAMEIDLLECAARFVELLALRQPPEFQESRARRFFYHFCQNLVWGHYPSARTQGSKTPSEALAILEEYFRECPEERIWRLPLGF